MTNIISFDLDGTLVDHAFSDKFWHWGISALYAELMHMGYKDARREVRRRFDEVGIKKLKWYDINYWWRELGLKGDSGKLIEECRLSVRAYPEAHQTLKDLHNRFRLIVITNGARELAEVELEQSGLDKYFERMFSATTDFKVVKKTGRVYLDILDIMRVSSADLVHVGDNWTFDYLAPKEAGIKSFYLDRDRKKSGNFVVTDLTEFSRRL